VIRGASLHGKDGPMLLLGLSASNVLRLTEGDPILIPAEEMAAMGLPPVGVFVCYGITEDALLAEMAAQGITFGTVEDRRR
jgi:hypothetical protein